MKSSQFYPLDFYGPIKFEFVLYIVGINYFVSKRMEQSHILFSFCS